MHCNCQTFSLQNLILFGFESVNTFSQLLQARHSCQHLSKKFRSSNKEHKNLCKFLYEDGKRKSFYEFV